MGRRSGAARRHRGLIGMPRRKAPTRRVETIVTFLEMTGPPHAPARAPANLKVALLKAKRPPVHFYRYLYDVVGRSFVWIDRKRLSDAELARLIHADTVDIRVLYVEGVPAGFFELDFGRKDAVWLQYFGLVPEFHGRGLGKWLLAEALTVAWEAKPERVRVETCTLDDPRALVLYQRAGFVPYARKDKVMEVPSEA
jgi:GNAT superfamily N-acetyltransferase